MRQFKNSIVLSLSAFKHGEYSLNSIENSNDKGLNILGMYF